MPRLFDPITLRGLTVRNRVWLAPMCQYSSVDGLPDDWHLAHLGARASGGFGLLLTEAAAVLPEGRISPRDAGLWNDAQATAWARVVDFAHSQGAAIGVQLAHAGRKASTWHPWADRRGSVPLDEGGWETVGPSTQPFDGYAAPRAMRETDLEAVVAAYADSARRAVGAGFDTVELHAAHGYLFHEFLSPLSNDRDDAWGGDLEGRSRLLRRCLEAVRGVVPDAMPVLVRISATDWVDDGWGVEQSVALAERLAELGTDLVDVSSGGNVRTDIPVGAGYQVPLAARVREAGVATGAVGLITEPAQAEQVLTTGQADVVLLARAALREPAWPLRAARELGVALEKVPVPPQHERGWD